MSFGEGEYPTYEMLLKWHWLETARQKIILDILEIKFSNEWEEKIDNSEFKKQLPSYVVDNGSIT